MLRVYQVVSRWLFHFECVALEMCCLPSIHLTYHNLGCVMWLCIYNVYHTRVPIKLITLAALVFFVMLLHCRLSDTTGCMKLVATRICNLSEQRQNVQYSLIVFNTANTP